MKNNILKIADLEFNILSCQLSAYTSYDNKIHWGIDVECDSHKEEKFYGTKPSLELNLFETVPNELTNWTQLFPRSCQWNLENDTDETPSGLLYLFEHSPLYTSSVNCYQGKDELIIELNGKCNVYYNDEYDTDLDIQIKSSFSFKGFSFGRRSESECKSEISKYFNKVDFYFTQSQEGISLLKPKS